MTGIGEAAEQNGLHRVTVTARSVNHRYFDLVLRLRPPYRVLEPELRSLVAADVLRGRVELAVEIEAVSRASGMEVCDEVAETLQLAARRWRRRGLVVSELSAGELLSAPHVLRSDHVPAVLSPEEKTLSIRVCRSAVAALVTEREREGRVLAAALEAHLSGLRDCIDVLAARRQEVVAGTAAGLEQRVRELIDARGLDAEAGGGLDSARLVQEVALLIERSDIAEELERLGGHLDGFAAAMAAEGAVGRRLDFLTQEILRELNTVGSKSRDLEMQHGVVEGKVLCEQLREQVQNVE